MCWGALRSAAEYTPARNGVAHEGSAEQIADASMTGDGRRRINFPVVQIGFATAAGTATGAGVGA